MDRSIKSVCGQVMESRFESSDRTDVAYGKAWARANEIRFNLRLLVQVPVQSEIFNRVLCAAEEVFDERLC